MNAPIAGVWTPWAEVLCRICHDQQKFNGKREIKWPAGEKREGDGQGFCTACGAQVWVQDEVAQLTRIRAIAGGEMAQTGGMCAALTLARPDGGTVVVSNPDGAVAIGIYKPGEWGEGGEDVAVYTLPAATPDDAAAAVIKAALSESLEGK
jgi:hypothetical protein